MKVLSCDEIVVKRIHPKETHDFILNKHYAQRLPSISFAYGMFFDDKLEGILTIGKPASNALCEGVCGKEYKEKVYELNRLIVNEGLMPNVLSKFVSTVLRDLKDKDLIIVSYADEGMNHHGYIYQATNFLYTGKNKERTDKYTEGNKHSRHYNNENNHLRKVRTSKHRYIYFTNNKKKWTSLLKYKVEPYPKGDNGRYNLGERMKTKVIDTSNNTYFYV